MQDIRDQRPQACEPTILAPLRLALFENDGIVLVHRQQAFAATGRSKNDRCVAAWRAALAAFPHDSLGDRGGLSGEPTEFAGNHFRYVPAG